MAAGGAGGAGGAGDAEDDNLFNFDKFKVFFNQRCTTNFFTEELEVEIEEQHTNPKHYNSELLNVDKDTVNKYGIVTHLACHGGETLEEFTLPPNIRVITFFRYGRSTIGSPYKISFIKYLAKLYVNGTDEEKKRAINLFPTLINTMDDTDSIKEFLTEKNFYKVNEHDPCTKIYDQEIDFHAFPKSRNTITQGLVRLYPNIPGTDEYTYFSGDNIEKINNNTKDFEEDCNDENSPNYIKHLILGYNIEHRMTLKKFIYLISYQQYTNNPDVGITIFVPFCRPAATIPGPTQLYRQISLERPDAKEPINDYGVIKTDDELRIKVTKNSLKNILGESFDPISSIYQEYSEYIDDINTNIPWELYKTIGIIIVNLLVNKLKDIKYVFITKEKKLILGKKFRKQFKTIDEKITEALFNNIETNLNNKLEDKKNYKEKIITKLIEFSKNYPTLAAGGFGADGGFGTDGGFGADGTEETKDEDAVSAEEKYYLKYIKYKNKYLLLRSKSN